MEPTTARSNPVPLDPADPLSPGDGHRYAAFISYRHAPLDRKWAKWLHRALEAYRVPKRLRRPAGLPPRVGRCFRDEEELPASADLSAEIDKALRQSKYLIVVCSPRAPASEWVNQEVVRFRQMGRNDRILALLIEGEPADSFPPALREIRRTVTDAAGLSREQVEKVEPLAADVRPSREESRGHLVRMARLRLLACILGVAFDDLRQREQERRVRRLAALGGGLAVLLAGAVGLSGFALAQWRRANEQTGVAETRRRDAEANAAEVRRQLVAAYVQQGAARWAADDAPLALLWFVKALETESAAPLTAPDPDRARRLAHHRLRIATALRSLPRPLDVRADTPDYPLRPAYGRRAPAEDEKMIDFGRTPDGQFEAITHGFGLARGGNDLAFSSDGRTVVTASHTTAEVWDSETKTRVCGPLEHEHETDVVAAALSPDGSRLVTAAADAGTVATRVWDARSGTLLTGPVKFENSDLSGRPVWHTVGFGPAGPRVVTRDKEGVVRVWDAQTGKPVSPRPIPDGGFASSFALNRDGTTVVTCSQLDDAVKVWDAATVAAAKPVLRAGFNPREVSFSWDGSKLIADAGFHHKVWAVADGAPADPPALQQDGMFGTAFSPDGARVATATGYHTVRVWDVATGGLLADLPHGDKAVAFSPDGSRLVTDSGGVAWVWDVASRRAVAEVHTGGDVYDVNFGPGNKVLVLATADRDDTRALLVWDAASGKPRSGPMEHESGGTLNGMFSPDGTKVAVVAGSGSASDAQRVFLWDVGTGKLISPAQYQYVADPETVDRTGPGGILRVAFSLDSRKVLAVGPDFARVWGMAPGDAGVVLKGLRQKSIIRWGAFSPDGSRVVTAGLAGEGLAQVCDAATGEVLVPAMWLGSDVMMAVFRPRDGAAVATAGEESVRVWDASTGQPLTPPLRHRGDVRFLAFSADGSRLLAGGSDATVRVWDLTPDARPTAELRMLAEWLAARWIDPAGDLQQLDDKDLKDREDFVRKRYPGEFAPGPPATLPSTAPAGPAAAAP